jgi:hypothetical protein
MTDTDEQILVSTEDQPDLVTSLQMLVAELQAEVEILKAGKQTFEAAVLDMGALFKKMKGLGVPHTVTLDIVRLQMMYMQQSNATTGAARVPDSAPDIVKVVEAAEEAGEIDD